MSDYNQTYGYSSAYPYSQYDQNQTAPRYNSTPHHDLPVENLTRALHHTNLDSHDSRSDAAYSHPPSSSLVYPSSHSQSTNGPALQAIPAALPKVDYAAPVFQTFQERKRAKEAALRAQNGASLPNPSYSSPPPKQTYTPPSATLAMMGSRQGGPPPAPPSRSSARPLSNSPSRHRSPLPTLPPPAVPPTATPATTLERSDTVSSIKSLDRLDFSASGKRPLPRTPIGVNSSKSLDRGLPTRSLDTRRSRQQPSVVVEEDEDASRPGSVVESSEQIEPPSISIPSIGVSDDKAPAKFTPLPTFNLPDGDSDDDQPGPSRSPQVAFTGLPTIQVSTEPSAATRITPSGAIVCAGCEQPIIGRIVNAMEQRFHPQCFRCNECGELLEHVSSYEWQGKAYCHLDYHDKFANHCYHCKTPIVDDRFVTLDDPVLGTRYYHELHFFCSECGDPFLDPSKSSAPGTTLADEEGETSPFVIQKGHPYCEKCHLRLHKPRCRGCKQPIPDVALIALDASWHKECFVCSSCGDEFANNLFFPQNGAALCTGCWEKTV